jgi:hypothetical protein
MGRTGEEEVDHTAAAKYNPNNNPTTIPGHLIDARTLRPARLGQCR